MTPKDISMQRLLRQQITHTKLKQPQALLHYMGAMQAQEYALAKWAIGLRLPGTSDVTIEADFNAGHILRTHVLRPTWHFVAPRDIRWLLQLTAPRVHAFNAFMYRKQELDQAMLQRCSKLIERSLRDGNYQTRSTISKLLQEEGIPSDTIRLSCIIMYAELEGLICSGPRMGKQFTYALLEERVAPVAAKSYEEALAALSLCYFTSRGPATVQDFAWWSGLTLKEARAGAATLPRSFEALHCEGKDYILKPLSAAEKTQLQTATFLLPDYDEYGISYKDRSALFPAGQDRGTASVFDHLVVVDGHAGGTWKQERKGKQLQVQTRLFEPHTKTQEKEVAKAVARYLAFAAPAAE
jgi:hypothetical protein